MKPSQSHIHTIRNLRYHVRTWGDLNAPKLFLLHGWMDVSASFQFLVDCLQRAWCVVAPDWRGFGLTEWAHEGYWFPDYYADLEVLLDIYQPREPVRLVGHSMGGNIACTYGGIRPQRVARVVSIEGFGMQRTEAKQAPRRYEKWLDQLHRPPQFRSYASFDAVAARLKQNNPRLADESARFLAQHWAKQLSSGEIVLNSDPKHKMVNPVLSRVDETLETWRRIDCPVLWIFSTDSLRPGWRSDNEAQMAERKGAFRDFRETTLADCGHMIHHDQPQRLAAVIEQFMGFP